MATPPKNLMQVTLYGSPLGKPVYADEILDMLASWCPDMTSRTAKRRAAKLRRRDRLRAKRGFSPSTSSAASPEPPGTTREELAVIVAEESSLHTPSPRETSPLAGPSGFSDGEADMLTRVWHD